MNRSKRGYLRLGVLGAVLFGLLIFSGACATAEKTPTPVPSATPAPAVAPTATLPPTATPTRVLPTPTPVATGKPQYGGTLRFALRGSIDNFDPAYNAQAGSRRPLYTMYNSLVELNPDGTIGPGLARSWEFSPDGKVITFLLNTGVKFHDGTDVDAQAVKWNFDRHLAKEVGSVSRTLLSPPLTRVEAPDSKTVQFYLSEPSRPFTLVLAAQTGQIVSPQAVTKLNSYSDRVGEFGRRPVGTGPFKFVDWRIDDRINVVRNENYWEKGLPYVDAIRFPIVPDSSIIFAMLRTGELDIMEELDPGDFRAAQANQNIEIILQKGVRVRHWQFRTTAKPWDNKALRQAFAYAFDRKTIVDVIYDGRFAEEAYSPIGSAHGVWFDPKMRTYEYNPKMARQKLAEAGYPNGFSYNQPCRSSSLELAYCETIQTMLKDVGINMAIQPWPQNTYVADFVARKFEIAETALRVLVDPHLLIQPNYHSKGASRAPRSNWATPAEVDRLIEKALTVYDVAQARALYYQIIGIMLEEAPSAFPVAEHQLYAIRRTTHNFHVTPDAIPRLGFLWLEK